jgi:hypothetical protein
VKLTPEDFEKLETKELANIIRKLGAGHTLTKREEEKLQRAKAKQNAGSENDEINFAYTWDELARILTQRIGVSVTRKSLQNWRNPRLFPDLADKWPRDRSDGRKDVVAWMRFMLDTGRNRADEILDDDEMSGDRTSVRDWKIYREELHCREAERRIARGDNLLLVATELEIPIGAMLAAINSKLALYPTRTARFMVMKRDVADAEQTLRDEMDAVLKDLNLAEYIDPPIDEIVSAFPFDDETTALYAKVSFGGQDRAAFLELIRACVEETLRRIGQRALSVTEQPTASDCISTEPKSTVPSATETGDRDSQIGAECRSTSAASSAAANPSVKPRVATRRRKRGGKKSVGPKR